MKKMPLNEIRKRYLDFFEKNDHLVHPSYPLVPQTDKSLLLISAGMVPLKEFFAGALKPPALRMATCQKCIRTNDIDNVGVTSRHASFFEMLGNFSFGDYFKSRAIHLAWEFVTKELALDTDKLWVTVYSDDDEAYNLWKNQENVPEERIVRLGKEDNFWEIGSGSGPCGPCSELYFDRGEAFGCDCEDCKPGCDCDRFVEFWNLVFTQYHQTPEGEYIPLENPNIDTGMGIERVACLLQDVDSIFDIDVMVDIRDNVVKIAGKPYGVDKKNDVSIRKITDHIRAVTFLVSDGVTPNNEGRGYVLRRLLRRAARHGRLLGIKDNFLFNLTDVVIDIFGEAYPELIERRAYIKKVIQLEEERFAQTVDQGLVILSDYIDDLQLNHKSQLSGELAFKLYDTYGFPLDLTLEILAEKNMTVDEIVFEKEMKAQRERARASAGTKGWDDDGAPNLSEFVTKFVGYDELITTATVVNILKDNESVDSISDGDAAIIILDRTPFYGEGGGQVGDAGVIYTSGGRVNISVTTKDATPTFMHHGVVENGDLSVGDTVTAQVTSLKRLDTARNHTATHLLHQALKDVLGDHVAQAGSLVTHDKLRFDFNHFEAMTHQEIVKVEELVNYHVLNGLTVATSEMSIDEAKAKGAMALFSEKYGDVVRVVEMGDYSIELCGGTHLQNTSQVGLFKIISESGVAAGVRRIEAITGSAVLNLLNDAVAKTEAIAKQFKCSTEDLEERVEHLFLEYQNLKKSVEKAKQASANNALEELESKAQDIRGIKVITGTFDGQSVDILRNLGDQVVAKGGKALAVLANVDGNKVNFVAMATDEAVKNNVHCGNIVKALAKICGGGGGGRPNMAQAGGKNSANLAKALQILSEIV